MLTTDTRTLAGALTLIDLDLSVVRFSPALDPSADSLVVRCLVNIFWLVAEELVYTRGSAY